jgi:GGL domain
MSAIQQQRKVVAQLRREAAIQRIDASVAVEDLKVNQPFSIFSLLLSFLFNFFSYLFL